MAKSDDKRDNAGRPPAFDTVDELEAKIEDYFKSGLTIKTLHSKEGTPYEVKVATITGLALYLGFCSRQSLYDYEKKEEFAYSVKKARLRIEQEYESNLTFGSPTGSIFALKNFGWKDKQETDVNLNTAGFIFLDGSEEEEN